MLGFRIVRSSKLTRELLCVSSCVGCRQGKGTEPKGQGGEGTQDRFGRDQGGDGRVGEVWLERSVCKRDRQLFDSRTMIISCDASTLSAV